MSTKVRLPAAPSSNSSVRLATSRALCLCLAASLAASIILIALILAAIVLASSLRLNLEALSIYTATNTTNTNSAARTRATFTLNGCFCSHPSFFFISIFIIIKLNFLQLRGHVVEMSTSTVEPSRGLESSHASRGHQDRAAQTCPMLSRLSTAVSVSIPSTTNEPSRKGNALQFEQVRNSSRASQPLQGPTKAPGAKPAR